MLYKKSRVALCRNVQTVLLFLTIGFNALADGSITSIADFSQGLDAKGIPKGWQLNEKSGKADFRLTNEDENHALLLKSASTSFSFQKQVNIDLHESPFLSWKWKVNKLPVGGDFRKTATDDQAAQLFVAFGRTKSIVYIWDSSAPQGLMTDAPSPPLISVKAVVVRSGSKDLGKWLLEKRNVLEDYQKFYGTAEKAPPISGMRLQINTQHTKTSGECCFADVNFASK
jgi:hypothetical protein